jgi:hypothetical protein
MSEDEVKRDLIWKVFLSCFAIFVSILTGLMGWLVLQVHRIDVDVHKLSSRMCSMDSCNGIQRDIDRLRARLDRVPSEVPPRWLLEKVEKLKERVTVLEFSKEPPVRGSKR